jgi:GNAT superfamily N-acetyltransferase
MVLEHFTLLRLTDTSRLEELLPLFVQYRQFYGIPGEESASRRFLEERLAAQDTLILGAESSTRGALVGFCQLFHSFSSLKMARFMVLNDLFVDADARGQGVGLLLMEAAKEATVAVGACGLMLDTSRENLRAQALYEQCGLAANEGSKYYYWFAEGGYVG